MMIKFGGLLPFSYFWSTRLRQGSVGFHLLFEWLAAAVLVVFFAPGDPVDGLQRAFLSYLAFISLYEIGYIANDLIVAPNESGGRLRGPQHIRGVWIACWMLARVSAFLFLGYVLGEWSNPIWWAFFGALAIVFSMHNWLSDVELKVGSFLWLSWFRFMAPVMFVVPDRFLLGIAFACAMSYSAFRQFGYLDSKGLLVMPGRKRPMFRGLFFIWPIMGAVVLGPITEARGYVVLTVYYALIASLGAAFMALRTLARKDAS